MCLCFLIFIRLLQNKRTVDQDVEDGEVDKVTFDAAKFIEYPGFNAKVPSNLIDVRQISKFWLNKFSINNFGSFFFLSL